MKTRDDDGGEDPVSDERVTMMGMKTRKQRGDGDSSSTVLSTVTVSTKNQTNHSVIHINSKSTNISLHTAHIKTI